MMLNSLYDVRRLGERGAMMGDTIFLGERVRESLTPTDGFSINSHAMLALRDVVLDVWEEQLRAKLPPARCLSRPVLIDTMPVFYERLSATLTPAYFERDGIDVAGIGAEHGVERANRTDFDVETVLAEFHMFRSVLFDALDAHGVALTGPERRALHLTIDIAVRESVRTFVGAADALRERVAGALTRGLRQPLDRILQAAALIRDQAPSAVAGPARGIVSDGERMAATLEELRDALAPRDGEKPGFVPEKCDLLALAHRAGARARSCQGLDVRVSGTPAVGWWSPKALERALDNLLDNARKYGMAGAPVEVTVSESNGRVVLAVSNKGAPVPQEAHEAIFERRVHPHDAAESAEDGWGIDLAYVRSVAHGHGGSAAVFDDAVAGRVLMLDIPIDARTLQNCI